MPTPGGSNPGTQTPTPARPTPPAPVPNNTTGPIADENDPLLWSEWWKRHDWIHTKARFGQAAVTGRQDEPARLSPKLESLVKELTSMLSDKYHDVRSSACLALGKTGLNSAEIRSALQKALQDKNAEVRQSAVLALGMIRAVESSAAVITTLVDKRQDDGLRSFAAISLGLMGSDANLQVLQNVASDKDTAEEVRAGAVIGLGLLGDERGGYTLLNVLRGDNRAEIKALAVTSLARLGKTGLAAGAGKNAVECDLAALFEEKLSDKEVKEEVRRAIAIALGNFGEADRSAAALKKAFRVDRDRGVRAFSLVSLGMLCAGAAAESPLKTEIRDFLRLALRGERDQRVLGFAALAAGLSGDRSLADDLLEIFNGKGDKDSRAAAVVGLGLLKHADAIDDLGSEVLKPRGEGDARGLSCVAMGMIGEPAASEFLKSVLNDANVPYLKWMAATGLAILGDRSAIPDITSKLSDRNLVTRDAAIRSLQYFRDEACIDPLLDQFRKESSNELRAMIVVTLGAIAQKAGEVPQLKRIGMNLDWTSAVRMPSIDLATRLF